MDMHRSNSLHCGMASAKALQVGNARAPEEKRMILEVLMKRSARAAHSIEDEGTWKADFLPMNFEHGERVVRLGDANARRLKLDRLWFQSMEGVDYDASPSKLKSIPLPPHAPMLARDPMLPLFQMLK